MLETDNNFISTAVFFCWMLWCFATVIYLSFLFVQVQWWLEVVCSLPSLPQVWVHPPSLFQGGKWTASSEPSLSSPLVVVSSISVQESGHRFSSPQQLPIPPLIIVTMKAAWSLMKWRYRNNYFWDPISLDFNLVQVCQWVFQPYESKLRSYCCSL